MRIVSIGRYFDLQHGSGGERIPCFESEMLAEVAGRQMAQSAEPDLGSTSDRLYSDILQRTPAVP